MSSELKRLPLGLSDFANVREEGENYLYVDKTQSIRELLNTGKYLFFSRPRRFGKSLLCSAIKYLYQGRRDLFQGLAIEPLWDWTKTNPVIHFCLTEVGSESPEMLTTEIKLLIQDRSGQFDVHLTGESPSRLLGLLLREIHVKTGRRVVVIIDEYEKPVHDHINDLPLARKLRDVLAAFYGSMKGCDADIEKLFVTGVGRMVNTSIFSGFNQMVDLTLDVTTANVCGYTDNELKNYFTPYIGFLANANGISIEKAWDTLRERYNGYWWGRGERVYNPWAILNCVRTREFSNFWWASGTPSMLVKIAPSLKEPEDMENVTTTDLSLLFDIEDIRPEALLWQTGYLTIKKVTGSLLKLGLPNSEVREAWSAMMLDRFHKSA